MDLVLLGLIKNKTGPMERMQLQVAKRRKPRSYRKMHKIWKVNSGEERPNITLNFNQHGQPIGANVPNFLATHAKGKDLPLSCEDWREVDLMAKDKVWERVKV